MSRISIVLILSVSLVLATGVAAGTSVTNTASAQPPGGMGVHPQTSFINESIKSTLEMDSSFGGALNGRTVNLKVKTVDGTTETWGARYDENGDVAELERGGYSSPDFTAETTETTARSIQNSESTGAASRKALSYGLVEVEGNKTATRALASAGTTALSQAQGPKTKAGSFDTNEDGTTDLVADIEGQDADGDGTVDSQLNTILRDTDNDGNLETVTSNISQINPFVTGEARIDTNQDGKEDTKLLVRAFDTDGDGRFDKRTKTLLARATGEEGQTTFSESTTEIEPTDKVTVTWDLTGNGIPDVRVDVTGKDTDGNGRFDRKTTTIHLNVDGKEGYETSTTTSGKVTPTLSLSIELDTNNDGSPDTKATFIAADSNGDGSYDTQTRRIVRDTDGDGEYDTTLSLVECERGFIQKEVCGGSLGSGEDIVGFLIAPANISRMGSIASIVGTLVQLYRGS